MSRRNVKIAMVICVVGVLYLIVVVNYIKATINAAAADNTGSMVKVNAGSKPDSPGVFLAGNDSAATKMIHTLIIAL